MYIELKWVERGTGSFLLLLSTEAHQHRAYMHVSLSAIGSPVKAVFLDKGPITCIACMHISCTGKSSRCDTALNRHSM